MQNILEILQTIGICVNALAVVAISIMIFFIWSTFVPAPPIDENDEELLLAEEENMEHTSKRKRDRRKR